MATPQPADVLLELAWEGGFTRPELAFAFGRVPAFSLLPDGSAYYLDPAEWDKAQVMVAHLAPAETKALIQRVLDLGFERLESYTNFCQPQPNGTCLCVADAGESVLWVRLPGGKLREVRNYYDFANDPEALTAIRSLLQDYQHPAATPYAPEKAAIFVRSVAPPSDLPILDWPLLPSWLAGGTPDAACVRALAGTDLQALLAVTGRNMGDFYFRADDQVYNVYLTPWLPGIDYADQIASSGQACSPAEEAADQETPNVQPGMNRLPTPAPLPGMPQPGATLTRPMNKDEMVMRYVPAGDFVPKGSVRFLGQEIARNVLVYEGGDKLVSYSHNDAIPWSEVIFDMVLEDFAYDNLPEAVQRQVDQVVSSFELAQH